MAEKIKVVSSPRGLARLAWRAPIWFYHYNRRHPAALRTLAGILGYRTDGREADVRFFAEVIPVVALISNL